MAFIEICKDQPEPVMLSLAVGGLLWLAYSTADMNPHQSQAFILDVSRGAGIGRVPG
jgi:hypothetical protein